MSAAANELTIKKLTSSDLVELAKVGGATCVSILMPTHRSGAEVQQDPIRLKNLLDEADQKLHAAGGDTSILDPLRSLPNQNKFWQHSGEGLAIFVFNDDVHLYRLNHSVNQHVSVGEWFYLKSLASDRSVTENYFVLALTWDDARLFSRSDSELHLVESSDLPAKFNDLVLERDPEEQIQFSSHQSQGGDAGGTKTAMYHGHGEGEDKIEADRRHYLSRVGELVGKEMYNAGRPLVVVGTDEVVGHFAAATDVKIAAKVEGSPADLTEDQWSQRTDATIAAKHASDSVDLAERFGTALAQSRASHDISEIVVAAIQGRVDTLIVVDPFEVRGTLDRQQMSASRDDAGDIELINAAIVETLRNGGSVVAGDRDQMPSGTSAAAIYRY